MPDWRSTKPPHELPALRNELRANRITRDGCFVPAFSESFDHFLVEVWNVIRLATGNQAVVHDDLNALRRSMASNDERLASGLN